MKAHDHQSDSRLATFTANDGENLAMQYWAVPEGASERGVVVIVHGLGEHAGRYENLAQWLVSRGFTVYGYDQCGHGDSSGTRGCLPNTMRLIEDLYDVIESARRYMRPREPLIVLGHSLGAVVAGCLLQLRKVPVNGLVLSSPAFSPRISALQRLLLSFMPRLAPNFTVDNGVSPECLSHDAEVVSAYRADPLVHRRISARLGYFISQAGPRLAARAVRWKLPTLLLYAGDDAVVDPRASHDFAEAAPPHLVTAHCFPDLYHEVLNEADAGPVYDALDAWLDQRFPRARAGLKPRAADAPGQSAAAAVPASPGLQRTRPRAAANPS
jgi:alpha-beta hydrolase superfamily lysophospholipase